jgi:hypothetical protein
MKKFRFLLLDAGPIIKLFSLGIWDEFIRHCDATASRIIAEDQALYTEDGTHHIDLKPYEGKGLEIIDVDLAIIKDFYDKFDLQYKAILHDGEKETLAFLYDESSKNWLVCSADQVVFKILGLLGKGEQGRSLEEMLKEVGLQTCIRWDKITPRDEDWKYTKKFREKWTFEGQKDFVQGKGLL